MRSPLFFAVLLGLICTCNAGLRHAYENIIVFLGYRAELLLLPEPQRIIGVKCAAADPATKKCLDGNPKYTSCKGSLSVKGYNGENIKDACNLREFLSHISGGKQYLKTDPLTGVANDYTKENILGAKAENALYFDVDDAAKRMLDGGIESKVKRNLWCKIKDGADNYEDSVGRLGRRIAALKQARTPTEVEKTGTLFGMIDDAMTGVVTDRRCDISSRLIPKLEKNGIKPLVIEPVDGTRRRFDEAATRTAIREAWKGKPDAENQIQQMLTKLDDTIKVHNIDGNAAIHKRVVELWDTFAPQQATVDGCTPRTGAVDR